MKLGLVSASTACLGVSLALLLRQPRRRGRDARVLHVPQRPATSEDTPRGFKASFPGRLVGKPGSRLR